MISEALRAQEHEYANRLHVITGLIELGELDQAAGYLEQLTHAPSSVNEDLRARLAPPELAALLTAKTAVARERGVRLLVTDDTELEDAGIDTQTLLTVVGNLVDNAIDAVAEHDGEHEVTVRVRGDDGILIAVDGTDLRLTPWKPSQPVMKSQSMRWPTPSFS